SGMRTIRRYPVAGELLAGERIDDADERARRGEALREVALPFERHREPVLAQLLRRLGLGVIEVIEEEELVPVRVDLRNPRHRTAERAAEVPDLLFGLGQVVLLVEVVQRVERIVPEMRIRGAVVLGPAARGDEVDLRAALQAVLGRV